MAIGAAGGGVLGGGLGALIQYGLNAKQASTSWDRQKNWATRGPSYMIQGYKDAGINPIVMATGGMNAGAQRAPQGGNVSAPDLGKNSLALSEIRQRDANTALAASQQGVAEAQAGHIAQTAREAGAKADIAQIDAAERKMMYAYLTENPEVLRREAALRGIPQNSTAAVTALGSGAFKDSLPDVEAMANGLLKRLLNDPRNFAEDYPQLYETLKNSNLYKLYKKGRIYFDEATRPTGRDIIQHKERK